jgi:hypothetical protein
MVRTVDIELASVEATGSFAYRWPDTEEEFTSGWDCAARWGPGRFRIRHGIGGRVVYGSFRVHTVTFVDDAPRIEGPPTTTTSARVRC